MLTALLLTLIAAAQPGMNADDPLVNLRHGVNLSHWYAQTIVGNYDEDHLANYFTADDAAKVADMGFDHVRLTLDDTVLFDPANPGKLKTEPLAKFRERVQMLLDENLAVIIDLHPGDAFKHALHDEANQEALAKNWAALAEAFKDVPADRLAFEVMNEPAASWPTEQWRPVQEKLAAAIRAAAPDHRIIVSAGQWTNAASLWAFEPYAVDNLVYTFHYYDPFFYTHQSASWGGPEAENSVGVPWPAEPDEADAIAERAGKADGAKAALRDHVSRGTHTRQHMTDNFDRVAAWADENNVPVYVGEFGVYTAAGEPADRYAFYRAVREEAERHDFGWAPWDYAGGFRMVEGDDRKPDAKMMEALGLDQ